MVRDRQARGAVGKLKAAWLRQVQKAYLNILWQHQLKLTPAILGLTTGKGAWGRWVERERRILLSQEIFQFPWAAVMGILSHEVAHQMVSELISPVHRRGETAHGSLFWQMGTRLGLDPFYLSSSVDLKEHTPQPWPRWKKEPVEQKSVQILAKIQKLLALSSSPVAAEAQAALDAAARLMARHNLEMLEDTSQEQPHVARIIELKARRLDSRLVLLAHILNKHFFVQTIFVPGYDPATDKESHDLELLGRPENTQLAQHLFHFLLERSETLWKAWHKDHRGGGLAARNSFIQSLLDNFSQKLDQVAIKEPGQGSGVKESSSALILAKDVGLEEFKQRRHPHLKCTRSGGRWYNPVAGQAGAEAGKALNFHRPLDGETQGPASVSSRPLSLPGATQEPKPASKKQNLWGEPL